MARKNQQRKRQQKKRQVAKVRAQRHQKKKQVAKVRVQRQAKQAARDGKVTAKETRKINKIAAKGGLKRIAVKRAVNNVVSNRNDNNKSTKIGKKADEKLGKSTRGSLGRIGTGNNTKNNNNTNNTNNTNKTTNSNAQSRTSGDKTEIKTSKDLDKLINKDFLDQDVITPQNKISGKKWKPDDIANDVAKQWGSRYKDDESYKPKELKVNAPNTPDRIKNYTSEKGEFDSEKYVSDVRSRMSNYAKKRGLSGNITRALDRKSPAQSSSTEPKYGQAINKLKRQLGRVNYRKQIRDTTAKLTGDVKPGRKGLKKIGLDLIKPRNSEDRALSPAQAELANDRFDQATKKNNKIFGQTRSQIEKATLQAQAKIDKREKRDAKRANERFDQSTEKTKVFGKTQRQLIRDSKRAKQDARQAKRANRRFDQATNTSKVFGKTQEELVKDAESTKRDARRGNKRFDQATKTNVGAQYHSQAGESKAAKLKLKRKRKRNRKKKLENQRFDQATSQSTNNNWR